jgi:hypothetical protein
MAGFLAKSRGEFSKGLLSVKDCLAFRRNLRGFSVWFYFVLID